MIQEVVSAVKRVLPKRRPIEHHEPWLEGAGLAVNGCLSQGLVGYGYVKKLEQRLHEICGVDHIVATCNGTSALHVALLASGIRPGEEVIVPATTFVGTANAVCHAGAIPHFIDCDARLSPFKLRQYLSKYTVPSSDKRGRINKETGRLISAVIVVHLFGFPAPIEELSDIAESFGLEVIEDAAEALGASVGNRMCGSFGRASILSFNNNKIVTTNGGGAVLTNDPWVAAKVAQLTTTARIKHEWEVSHDEVAWNYRMPNINAAVGLGQLIQFDRIIAAKRKLAGDYLCSFAGVGGCKLLEPYAWRSNSPNFWLNALILDTNHTEYREPILKALHEEGIKARAAFTPLHMLPMYKDHPRSDNKMHMAELFYRSTICLPSGPGLAYEDSGSIH